MAIDSSLVELINKEIDGINSRADSAKLKEYLAENREAKDLYNDLVRVSTLLKTVDEVEVPRSLRASILNTIDSSRYAVRERRNPLRSVIDLLPQRVSLRYAFVFSFGLVVGLVIYALFVDMNKDASIDISKLHGTMVLNRASESFETADNVEINLDKVHGTVTTKHARGLLSIEVNLQSQQEIETLLEFDPSAISFTSFEQPDNAKNNVNIRENSLRLTGSGDNKCLLMFNDKAPAATSVNLKIFSSGTLVYEKVLSTRRKS
jgi:hypothetical protein